MVFCIGLQGAFLISYGKIKAEMFGSTQSQKNGETGGVVKDYLPLGLLFGFMMDKF